MKHSAVKGFSFGLTSGIVTTLGLLVGLYSGTGSKLVVIGGILSIAVADAFSDALGMHVSEEADAKMSAKQVWVSTIATWVTKFFFALTFVIPFIFLDIKAAVIASIIWGLFALGAFSFKIALDNKENPVRVVGEHLLIAVVVVIITYVVGHWIDDVFI